MQFIRKHVDNKSCLFNCIIVSGWDFAHSRIWSKCHHWKDKRWCQLIGRCPNRGHVFSFSTQGPVVLGPSHLRPLQLSSRSGPSTLVATTRLGSVTTEPRSTSTSTGCFCSSTAREPGAPIKWWMSVEFWEALVAAGLETVWPPSLTGNSGTNMIGDLLTLLCPVFKVPEG